jgi:hypothetical protein
MTTMRTNTPTPKEIGWSDSTAPCPSSASVTAPSAHAEHSIGGPAIDEARELGQQHLADCMGVNTALIDGFHVAFIIAGVCVGMGFLAAQVWLRSPATIRDDESDNVIAVDADWGVEPAA